MWITQGEEGCFLQRQLPRGGMGPLPSNTGSSVSAHLIRALALCLKLYGTCPITPLHIAEKENSMTDIPSHPYGSEPKWHCKSNTDLLTLFNSLFPIPSQNSWTVFQISYAVGMRLTSVLQMKDFTLEEWRRLPKVGKHVGAAGQPMSHLWEWTLSYRTPHSLPESASLQAFRVSPYRLLRSRKTDLSWKHL